MADSPKVTEARGKVSGERANLAQAFGIRRGEVVSLVGAGGKTSLMLALARELAAGGEAVITTTTTRIFDWQAPGTSLIVEQDEEKMMSRLSLELCRHRHITLAGERLSSEGKLAGISPELVVRIAGLGQIAYTIIEADGAARKPLKAPNATEPVVPENTTLVIPVVGIDALGKELTEENVFRPEIVSRLTGLPTGSAISAEAVAILITHPQGIIKGSPARARIIPLINKVDLAGSSQRAEDLATSILSKRHPRIERVVLGQVRYSPLVQVVTSSK